MVGEWGGVFKVCCTFNHSKVHSPTPGSPVLSLSICASRGVLLMICSGDATSLLSMSTIEAVI